MSVSCRRSVGQLDERRRERERASVSVDPEQPRKRSDVVESFGVRVDAALRSHAAATILGAHDDALARLRARTTALERRVVWLERLLVITAAIAVAALLAVLRSSV
jgi:hypothetical protein